jgi:glycosyltransferase involved in cell wall biosynthesis
MRILYVANKTLPRNDYRLLYSDMRPEHTIIYALPKPIKGGEDKPFFKVGFTEGVRYTDIFSFIKLLVYLLANRRRLDLVHFYSTKLILFGPLVTALVGMPSIITITGLGRTFSGTSLRHRALQSIYGSIMRLAIRNSSFVLFQNHGDMARFAQMYAAHVRKFRYIGSAVSMPIARHKDFDTPQLTVLLVTRIMPEKGVEDFLSAGKALSGSGLKFVLVGPRIPGADALWANVVAAADAGHIEYKGEIFNERLLSEFQQAHIFFFPSRYPEGIARVMLEAGFSCLCPVVYDIVSNRDVIAPGRGFLISSSATHEEVQNVLRQLAQDRRLLEENARAYQDFILTAFTPEGFAQKMDAVLASVSKAGTTQDVHG